MDGLKFITCKEPRTVDEAKMIINELQVVAKSVFTLAWANKWHEELALYAMSIKEKSKELVQ